MSTGRGRYLAELRRSNAANIHDTRPTRTAVRQSAIREELMYDLDAHLEMDYEDRYAFPDTEPTDEDLRNIEAEEYVPGAFDDEVLIDPEEMYPPVAHDDE